MHQTLHFVLEQSAAGHHHLFGAELIRKAFAEGGLPAPLDENTASAASSLLDSLRQQTDLDGQRACISAAPVNVQEVVVHLYFSYLDRFMARQGMVFH